jgi:hypothetical protein
MINRAGLAILIGAMLAAGSAVKTQAGEQTSGSSVSLTSGTTLNAELSAAVDSKKAKAGDAVMAQITEAVKEDGKIVVPKGAKIVGHVTQSSARAKGDPGSALGIHFEKAVLKGGQEIPLNVWIRAIAAEPRSVYQPGPEQNTLAGTPAAGTSPMSGRSAMGGPPAGAGAPPVGVTNSSPDDSGPGNAADKASGAAGGLNAAGQLSPNSRGVFGLDGVHLATDASNLAQGSLITSSGKNVRLDSGTRLLLVFVADVSATPNK